MRDARLTDRLRQALPPNVSEKDKRNLLEVADLLEDLGRASGTARGDDLYVDEKALRKLLRKATNRDFEERCIASLAALPDSKLIRESGADEGRMRDSRKVGWDELSAHIARNVPAGRLRNVSLSDNPSQDELLRELKKQFPDLPDDFVDPPVFRAHVEKIVESDESSAARGYYDPWGCLVNHLGFWGAVAAVVLVFVVIMAIDAAIILGGPFWVAFWAAMAEIGVVGVIFYVIVLLVSCLMGFRPPF